MEEIARHFERKAAECRQNIELLEKGRRTKRRTLRLEKAKEELEFAEWTLRKQNPKENKQNGK